MLSTLASGRVVSEDGTLYAVLMLDKLHEARVIARAFDAGAEGRYRALLADRLKGTEWLGVEIWLSALAELRLVLRNGKLSCTDLRVMAAADLPPLDLIVLDHLLDRMDEAEARALVLAHLARSALVLVLMPAARMAERWLPAQRASLVHGSVGVHFLSGDEERQAHLARLQGMIPPLIQRTLPDDSLRWTIPSRA